jgi:glycosyltransferase involved in cell wall biosynthesis
MATPKILIDGYFLGRPSGYGRVIFELCRALGSADLNCEIGVVVPTGVEESFLTPYNNITYHRMGATNIAIWEQIKIPLFALRRQFDVIHFPYNTRTLVMPGIKSVTTVHDLTFLKKDAKRDAKSALIHFYMRTIFRLGTRKSDTVIAVSDTTQTALQELGIASSRIYNTVDGFLGTTYTDPTYPAPRPYFLHRGSYAPGHRNTDRIIQAFLGTPELRDTYTLKILGVPAGAERWGTTPDQPVEYLARVTDAELASLYAGSSCVVAVSLLEGFCLPIVEGFGFGSPVITSSIDPMKEIAGGAALLVCPDNTDEIAQGMLRVVSDNGLAKGLVEKGRARLKAFGSDYMAEQHLDVYRRGLDRNQEVGGHTERNRFAESD